MESSVEAMTFAQCLVRFCIEQDGMYWVTRTLADPLEGVIREVGTAIRHFIRQADGTVADCKRELSISSPSEFTRFALSAARHYFPRGYTHEAFLSYSGIVVGVTCLFHREGSTRIAPCAAQALGTVLIAHVLTRRFDEQGGYAGLARMVAMYSGAVEGKRRGKDKRSV